MIGNFVTGMSVLAPIGMLPDLAAGLNVGVSDAGLLITFGAIVLSIASPVMAGLTSRIDRRVLLGAVLLIATLGHVASAFAPNYAALLAIRIVMLAAVALYTPQAAATSAMIAPPEKRGSTITYVFLGWAIALATGLPVMAYLAAHVGWREAYASIAVIAFASFLLVAWFVPRGLKGAAVDLKTWTTLAQNPLVLTLLAITALLLGGLQMITTFLAPIMRDLGASPEAAALIFASYGVGSFVGNMIASRIVDRLGVWRTSVISTSVIVFGLCVWSVSPGVLPLMFIGVAFWGMGFSAANSMQQIRLVTAAPALSTAAVSLNTSMIYVGQGVGSAISGVLYDRGMYAAMNIAAITFLLAALCLILVTRERHAI